MSMDKHQKISIKLYFVACSFISGSDIVELRLAFPRGKARALPRLCDKLQFIHAPDGKAGMHLHPGLAVGY